MSPELPEDEPWYQDHLGEDNENEHLGNALKNGSLLTLSLLGVFGVVAVIALCSTLFRT